MADLKPQPKPELKVSNSFNMNYKTKKQLLTNLINEIQLSVYKRNYVLIYPEILDYANSKLFPYWLEKKVMVEIKNLFIFQRRETLPKYVTKYRGILSIQLYKEIYDYYTPPKQTPKVF